MSKDDSFQKRQFLQTQLTFGMTLVSANILLDKDLFNSLPPQYWEQTQVTLGFEYGRVGNRVVITDKGVKQTFIFGQTFKEIFLPWNTVYMIEGLSSKARKRWRKYEPEGMSPSLEIVSGGVTDYEDLPTPPVHGHLTLVRNSDKSE